jgi:hypothetical protein
MEPEPPEDDVIEVVQSVGELDEVVVTLREFLHRSGATRACAVVPGMDEPALVDVGRLQPVEVAIGERVVQLPHALELPALPLPLGDVRQLPHFDVDREKGEVASPLGGLEHYGEAVLHLAEVLGIGSVALATWATNDPETPLSISARGGDPLVVALGEEEFEMDPSWPPGRRA